MNRWDPCITIENEYINGGEAAGLNEFSDMAIKYGLVERRRINSYSQRNYIMPARGRSVPDKMD